jgi:hypothetical protein
MKESRAKLFALQEIEDTATIRLLYINFPIKDWEYVLYESHERKSNMNLAFLWNKHSFKKLSEPKALMEDVFFEIPEQNDNTKQMQSNRKKLFDRPPLVMKFHSEDLDEDITFINVHLKAQIGKNPRAKRQAQIKWQAQINALERSLRYYSNVIVLGDFNRDPTKGQNIPFLEIHMLTDGYSFDGYKSNIDFFGFYLPSTKMQSTNWKVSEVESAIKKYRNGQEIPDHDIIVLTY